MGKIRTQRNKSKGNGEGTIYISSKTGLHVGQYVLDGKRHSVYQRKNEKIGDFKARFNKIITSINEGTYIEKSKKTLINILNEYVENKYNTNQVSPATYKRDLYILEELKSTCKAIIDMPIQKITISHIKKVLPNMTIYSNSIIDKMYRFLNKAFKIALSERIIIYNPMENESIKKPKSQKATKKVEALTIEEHKHLLQVLQSENVNKKYANIILMQLYTGMRIGEVLALSKDCIDLKNGTIKVYRTLTRNDKDKTIMGKGTKTNAGSRTFYISENTIILLKEILNNKIMNMQNLLFYDYEKNDYITPSQVNCYLKRLNEKYNITSNMHTHMLRHTFATRFIEAGGNPKVLQVILGHSKIDITLNTYTSVLEKFNKDETSKYTDYLQEVGIV